MMTRAKYDLSKVPRELLEQFALDTCCSHDNSCFSPPLTQRLADRIRESAKVVLRTRAEVNTEIAETVRKYTTEVLERGRIRCEKDCPTYDAELNDGRDFRQTLFALTQEETAD